MIACNSCQQDFIVSPWEQTFYWSLGLSGPEDCPTCRLKLRLSFRNERHLYQRHCDLCQQDMVSLYPEDSKYTVYCKDCWWSDKWDPYQYGIEFDFDKPFFEQFQQIFEKVPRLGLIVSHGENSDYCTFSVYYKDCYMCVSGVVGENILYSYFMNESKDCLECSRGFICEQLYECIDSHNLYNSQFCVDCENSADLFMCTDMVSCMNCIGCVGLRHKQYYVFNKPVSEQEYKVILKEVKKSWQAIQETRQKHIKLLRTVPRIYSKYKSIQRCSGDHIYNSTNAHWSFDVINIENGMYLWNIPQGGREVADMNYSPNCEKSFNILSAINSHDGVTLWTCWDTPFSQYSIECFYGSNIFGSVGIKHGNNVILNKKYEQEEYQELVKRIKAHMKGTKEWGKFFPVSLTPFAYNETIANDFFPLDEQLAEQEGYRWRQEQLVDYTNEPNVMPDNNNDTSDNILKEVYSCNICGKPYKFIKAELEFYKQHNIPLTRWCPSCRHQLRFRRRNPDKLWNRTCMCNKTRHGHEGPCTNQFKTTYAPQRDMIVYCESCYQKEMY